MTIDLALSDYGPRLVRAFENIPVVDATLDMVRADVHRGRRARMVRRIRRTIVRAAALAGVGSTAAVFAPASSDAPAMARPVAIVAYRGVQPSGFAVEAAPAKQPVQVAADAIQFGSGPTALVATLLPANAIPAASIERPVVVAGRQGWIVQRTGVGAPGVRLLLTTPDGQLIVVDAADGLHWTDAELLHFATGLRLAGGPPSLVPTTGTPPAPTDVAPTG